MIVEDFFVTKFHPDLERNLKQYRANSVDVVKTADVDFQMEDDDD